MIFHIISAIAETTQLYICEYISEFLILDFQRTYPCCGSGSGNFSLDCFPGLGHLRARQIFHSDSSMLEDAIGAAVNRVWQGILGAPRSNALWKRAVFLHLIFGFRLLALRRRLLAPAHRRCSLLKPDSHLSSQHRTFIMQISR